MSVTRPLTYRLPVSGHASILKSLNECDVFERIFMEAFVYEQPYRAHSLNRPETISNILLNLYKFSCKPE